MNKAKKLHARISDSPYFNVSEDNIMSVKHAATLTRTSRKGDFTSLFNTEFISFPQLKK
jgi:hypothetical protein